MEKGVMFFATTSGPNPVPTLVGLGPKGDADGAIGLTPYCHGIKADV
jgi:hypothetical protein